MNELIVIAGIILIAIAIIGGFTGHFNIPQLSKKQRGTLAIFGILVLLIGVWSPFEQPPPPVTPTPTPTPTPIITPTPPPTVTPTPTPTLPPTPFVDVTKPKEKDQVSWRYMVEGSSSATKDSGLSVYALIWPIEADGPWWVQPTTTFSDGSWQSYAYFGRDPNLYPGDIGTTYRVVVIITTQKLRGGQTFVELPDSVAKSKEIIVTRI